jgi:hypothetical protein
VASRWEKRERGLGLKSRTEKRKNITGSLHVWDNSLGKAASLLVDNKGDPPTENRPYQTRFSKKVDVYLVRLLECAAMGTPVDFEVFVLLHAEATAVLAPANKILDLDFESGYANVFSFFFFGHLTTHLS